MEVNNIGFQSFFTEIHINPLKRMEKLLDSLHIHRIKILMFSYLYKPHYKVIMKYSFDEELHKKAPSFF